MTYLSSYEQKLEAKNNIQVTDTPSSGLVFVSDDSGTNTNVTSLGGGVYQIASLAANAAEVINVSFTIDLL